MSFSFETDLIGWLSQPIQIILILSNKMHKFELLFIGIDIIETD